MQPLIYRTVYLLFSCLLIVGTVNAQITGDHCSGAIPVTNADCGSTYNIKNALAASAATPSAAPAGSCGSPTAATTYDMWFTYQAVSTSATVTLSLPGGT